MLDLLFKYKIRSISNIQGLSCIDRKQAQSKIGTLRTDNGKEYTSNAFEDYLHQHGIAYNPQQNGVAKRMNRTIMNMVRSMMFLKNVKLMFWGDAVKCAAYLAPRVSSSGRATVVRPPGK